MIKEIKKELESYGINIVHIYPTGSNYICNPQVIDTDIDILVLVTDINGSYNACTCRDWEDCYREATPKEHLAYQEEKRYGVIWHALRRGIINIMIVEDIDWYHASVAATELCKAWNILDRDRRIRIFRNLKYGEPLQKDDLKSYGD